MKELGIGVGLGLVALLAIGGVAFYLYRRREAFDPTSDKNVAYSTASSAVVALTGGAAQGGEDSLGGVAARFREWWSGDDARIRAMTSGAPQASAAYPAPYSINPRDRT